MLKTKPKLDKEVLLFCSSLRSDLSDGFTDSPSIVKGIREMRNPHNTECDCDGNGCDSCIIEVYLVSDTCYYEVIANNVTHWMSLPSLP